MKVLFEGLSEKELRIHVGFTETTAEALSKILNGVLAVSAADNAKCGDCGNCGICGKCGDCGKCVKCVVSLDPGDLVTNQVRGSFPIP